MLQKDWCWKKYQKASLHINVCIFWHRWVIMLWMCRTPLANTLFQKSTQCYKKHWLHCYSNFPCVLVHHLSEQAIGLQMSSCMTSFSPSIRHVIICLHAIKCHCFALFYFLVYFCHLNHELVKRAHVHKFVSRSFDCQASIRRIREWTCECFHHRSSGASHMILTARTLPHHSRRAISNVSSITVMIKS